MSDIERFREQAARAAESAPGLVRGSDAAEARAGMLAARDEAARISLEARAVADAKRAEIDAKMAELDAMKRSLDAELAPILETVRGLNRVVDAIGLYLGIGEQFVPVRADGERAGADEKLVIYQSVLALDEESKLAADAGGIDCRDLDAIDDWLQDDAHLDQIIPSKLGVVAMIPRRAEQSTGDPFRDEQLRRANTQAWFLVRNGDLAWRFTVGEVQLGARLIPSPAEFERFFLDRDGNRIEPGTLAWERAEEKSLSAQRHAMRIGLILQGMLDRTDLLSPAIAQGSLDLLTAAGYGDPRVQLVLDDERALPSGLPSWPEFQKRALSRIQPGSRIVGDFSSWSFRREMSADAADGFGRRSVQYASDPESFAIHEIDRADSKWGMPGWRFLYQRTDKVWRPGEWEPSPAKTRASWFVLPSDRNIIAIDEVTVDELRHYATSRTEARHYLDSIPLIRAALAMKEQERVAQQPFLDELARRLEAIGIPAAEAPERAERGLGRWRTATKWTRPLLDLSEHRALETMTSILRAEVDRIEHADADERAVRTMRERVPGAVAVYRRASGEVLAFAPEDAPELERSVLGHTFYAVHAATAARLEPREPVRWQTASKAQLRQARLLWADPAWDDARMLSSRAADPSAVSEPELREAADTALDAARAEGMRPLRVISLRRDEDVLVAVVGIDFDARTMTAIRFCIRGGGGAQRLSSEVDDLGWINPRGWGGSRMPSVRVSEYAGRYMDDFDILWSDDALEQQLADEIESENRQHAELREREDWWRSITSLIHRKRREISERDARAALAKQHGADDRLWPRRRLDEKIRELGVDERALLAAMPVPEERFDATGKTVAELAPDALGLLPDELHEFVPVGEGF